MPMMAHIAVDEGSSPVAGDFVAVPDWFAWENQDCGLAVADIDGDGNPDVVVMMVDDPAGQNTGQYRVGRNFAADGTVGLVGPVDPHSGLVGLGESGRGRRRGRSRRDRPARSGGVRGRQPRRAEPGLLPHRAGLWPPTAP